MAVSSAHRAAIARERRGAEELLEPDVELVADDLEVGGGLERLGEQAVGLVLGPSIVRGERTGERRLQDSSHGSRNSEGFPTPPADAGGGSQKPLTLYTRRSSVPG